MDSSQLQRRQRYPGITKERIKQFRSALFGTVYGKSFPVLLRVASTEKRISFDEAMKLDFHPCKIGDHFGPFWCVQM